jgi:Flp pilus assembly protein TadB
LLLLVWAIAMLAWFLVSKYAKSSDMDRIKARLSGTTKAKAKKGKAAAGEPTVIQKEAVIKNHFAQLLVEKFQLGPKIGTLLEQAGLDWQPARLVHFTLMSFIAGFAVGWLLLPSRGRWRSPPDCWPAPGRSCTYI